MFNVKYADIEIQEEMRARLGCHTQQDKEGKDHHPYDPVSF